MFTSKTFRLTPLLLALLFMAACTEETIGPIDLSDQSSSGRAVNFEGPSRVTFQAGDMQSANYFAVHSGGHDIELEVIRAPAGAAVEIADQGGSKKRATLNWNPGHEAEGTLHLVSLKASTASFDWSGEFEIYVALQLDADYPPPNESDDEVVLLRENKPLGVRK